MTHNLSYGDKVSQILNSNHIWAEFRDQKHDLFITDTNVRGYLTGKSAAIRFQTLKQTLFSSSNSIQNTFLDPLFIHNSGVAPAAGYLTQGPSKNVEVLTSPPPMDRDDPLARTNDDAWDGGTTTSEAWIQFSNAVNETWYKNGLLSWRINSWYFRIYYTC